MGSNLTPLAAPAAAPAPVLAALASPTICTWSRVLLHDQTGQEFGCGTITFCLFRHCSVLVDGEQQERAFLDTGTELLEMAVNSHLTGCLVPWPNTSFLPAKCFTTRTLTQQSYDLRLATGETISACYFKQGVFTQIAHPHRWFTLASVEQLRPTAS